MTMKRGIFFIITAFLIVSNIAMAGPGPALDQVIKDSKPEKLSIKDKLFLKPVTLEIGAARVKALVNRLTNRVEYIRSYSHQRYVRPKFVMANAQAIYDDMRRMKR